MPIADKMTPQTGSAAVTSSIASGIFDDVEVAVSVRLGETTMTIAEIAGLGVGAVVSLDVRLNEPAILYLKERPIARGEIVAVDEYFGGRISEILSVKAG